MIINNYLRSKITKKQILTIKINTLIVEPIGNDENSIYSSKMYIHSVIRI